MAAEDDVAQEAAQTLVDEDGVAPERAMQAVLRVLARDRGRSWNGRTLSRAARGELEAQRGGQLETEKPESEEVPRQALATRRPPPRKGTRADTPAAKKHRR